MLIDVWGGKFSHISVKWNIKIVHAKKIYLKLLKLHSLFSGYCVLYMNTKISLYIIHLPRSGRQICKKFGSGIHLTSVINVTIGWGFRFCVVAPLTWAVDITTVLCYHVPGIKLELLDI